MSPCDARQRARASSSRSLAATKVCNEATNLIQVGEMAAKATGRFIDPMLLLRTDSLPNDGGRWEYQLKFDGYRAIAFKSSGKVHLRSRNDSDFSVRYADAVKGLANLPAAPAVDGTA